MLLLFLIPAVLSGCSQEKKEAHVFYARILEIRESTMLVRPEEGSEEAGSADTFVVDMTGMDLSPEPAVGDYIAFGDADPAEVSGRVVALHMDCTSWEERHWEEAMFILDTVTFVPAGEEE